MRHLVSRWVVHCACILLLVVSSIADAHPPRYRALQATTAANGYSQFGPVINNRGEIVYLEQRLNVPGVSIVSTLRGELVRSENLGSQDLNDRGEVVWQDVIPGLGFHVFSNLRGTLGPGGSPRINRRGDVAALLNVSDLDPQPIIVYRADGTSERVTKDPAATFMQTILGHSLREIIYFATSLTPQFHGEIFSTRRGSLFSHEPSDQVQAIGANNRGQLVMVRNGVLYLPNGEPRRTGLAAGVDVNDFGDVVLGEVLPPTETGNSSLQILLFTKRPEYFIRRYGFSYRD